MHRHTQLQNCLSTYLKAYYSLRIPRMAFNLIVTDSTSLWAGYHDSKVTEHSEAFRVSMWSAHVIIG